MRPAAVNGPAGGASADVTVPEAASAGRGAAPSVVVPAVHAALKSDDAVGSESDSGSPFVGKPGEMRGPRRHRRRLSQYAKLLGLEVVFADVDTGGDESQQPLDEWEGNPLVRDVRTAVTCMLPLRPHAAWLPRSLSVVICWRVCVVVSWQRLIDTDGASVTALEQCEREWEARDRSGADVSARGRALMSIMRVLITLRSATLQRDWDRVGTALAAMDELAAMGTASVWADWWAGGDTSRRLALQSASVPSWASGAMCDTPRHGPGSVEAPSRGGVISLKAALTPADVTSRAASECMRVREELFAVRTAWQDATLCRGLHAALSVVDAVVVDKATGDVNVRARAVQELSAWLTVCRHGSNACESLSFPIAIAPIQLHMRSKRCAMLMALGECVLQLRSQLSSVHRLRANVNSVLQVCAASA